MTTEPDAIPDSAPGLTAVTVAALQGAGRLVATDWDTETFDVYPRSDDEHAIAGVILHSTQSVALYVVWDEFVPFDARPAVADWSVRANTDLTTCAIEFSQDTGILAVRAVVHLGPVGVGVPGEDMPEGSLAIARSAFGALLAAAADEVQRTYESLAPTVAELIGQ